jgi:hypothetical protein
MEFTKKKHSIFTSQNWIKTGLVWGALMFLFNTLGFPYFRGENITLEDICVGLILWTIGGLAFGYTMRLFITKLKPKK